MCIHNLFNYTVARKKEIKEDKSFAVKKLTRRLSELRETAPLDYFRRIIPNAFSIIQDRSNVNNNILKVQPWIDVKEVENFLKNNEDISKYIAEICRQTHSSFISPYFTATATNFLKNDLNKILDINYTDIFNSMETSKKQHIDMPVSLCTKVPPEKSSSLSISFEFSKDSTPSTYTSPLLSSTTSYSTIWRKLPKHSFQARFSSEETQTLFKELELSKFKLA